MVNTIYLQDLSGGDFEELCRCIFSKYYGVPVERTPLVNDKGRDLIIHLHDGDAFVECKHQPNTSIGRPIVQKLHSAMVTGNIKRGMIVTTGRFSSEAIKHVSDNSLPIKLVDIYTLKTTASSVGYELITEDGESVEIKYVQLSNDNEFKTKMINGLKNKLSSAPLDLMQLTELDERNTTFESYYRIDYSIDAEFNTNVGTIHSEKSSGVLFIREEDGQFLSKELTDFYIHTSNSIYSQNSNIRIKQTLKIMPHSQIKDISVECIIENHSKHISYHGKNNQKYHKFCIPQKKDVFIDNIAHIFLPSSKITYTILEKQRFFICAEGNNGNFINTDKPLCICDICNTPIHKKGIVCSYCGNMAELKKHGYFCSICGCSLCIKCGRYYRKYLLLKKPICYDCSMKNPEIKIKKYVIK